ncbi:MAG: SRPBCC family protein [Actinobacteria bacterium]|nr:SRPBCC family protein [Actinomycetota bacterium]
MAGSDTYTVERSGHVEAPAEQVRERIVDFRRWTSWSPWEDLDPALSRNYGGADAGVGAWYEWQGNRKAGEGRMEIVDVTDSAITIDLQFLKPFKSRSTTRFELQPEEGGTTVTWTMTGPKTFMTKVMGIFTSMDKLIGPDFEKGLDRLKAEVESPGDTTTSG